MTIAVRPLTAATRPPSGAEGEPPRLPGVGSRRKDKRKGGHMSDSVHVPKDVPTARDDIRKSNPYRRTVYDARLSNALAVYAKSTR